MPTDDRPTGIEALVSYIASEYPNRFDEERRKRLCERIAAYRRAGDAVSEVDLSNADEPAFRFEAYRRERNENDIRNGSGSGDETDHERARR